MSIPEELEGKYILLSVRATREKDGRFSAFCDELGIATCGDSKEGALSRLQNTMVLILTKATERGDILELLEGRSIRLYPMMVPRNREEDLRPIGERIIYSLGHSATWLSADTNMPPGEVKWQYEVTGHILTLD